MKSADGFDKIPNKMMVALYTYGFSPTQMQVVLYVLHKTCGWNKHKDRIAISKMARDLGKYRQKVSGAVSDLQKMNVLEVERERSNMVPNMRVLDPEEWEQTVTISGHVTKRGHVTKSGQGVSPKRDSLMSPNGDTQETYIRDTYKETGVLPSKLIDDELTEEEIREGGWTI